MDRHFSKAKSLSQEIASLWDILTKNFTKQLMTLDCADKLWQAAMESVGNKHKRVRM
jgi:hypothetical protein